MSLQSINLYNQLASHKLFKKTINFNLTRIKLVLKKLGNPQNKLSNVINIIGSDGKYSLLTSLKYFIEENKQTVSAYISPSLKDISERFWMGNRYLTHQEIKSSVKIIEKLKVRLTIFEVLTVIFIINAAKRNNDFNLVEAGALFAKDSTNIFDFPLIQAVTNINLQHLNFLKNKTIDEVVKQKVGFLSQFTKVYIGKQKSKTLKKIKFYLKKNKSEKIYSNTWKLLKRKNNYFYKDKKTIIKLNNKNIHSVGLLENLCMAIKIALDLKISKKIIKKAVPKIFFEGRIQYLKKGKIKNLFNKKEKVIVDGCSSQISAKNLADHLKTIKGPKFGIWGMIKNKNPDLFIQQFKNVFEKIIIVPIEGEANTLPTDLLMRIAKKNNFNVGNSSDIHSACKKISNNQSKTIVFFGSFYLAGNVLRKN